MEIDRVAVELNRAILPKSRFAETALTDGDCWRSCISSAEAEKQF